MTDFESDLPPDKKGGGRSNAKMLASVSFRTVVTPGLPFRQPGLRVTPESVFASLLAG